MRLRTTRVLGGRRTKVPNHRSIDRNNDVAFLEVPGRRRHRSIRHPTPNRLCSVFITGLEGSPCSASSSHSSKDGKRYKTPCRLFPSFLCLPSRPTTSRFLSSLRLNPLPPPPPHIPFTKNPSRLTMKFTTTLAILFSASTTILAAPVRFAARDVWVPKILEPTAETTWEVGKTYSVEWALDQEPASVTNPNGTIFLSKNGRLNISA